MYRDRYGASYGRNEANSWNRPAMNQHPRPTARFPHGSGSNVRHHGYPSRYPNTCEYNERDAHGYEGRHRSPEVDAGRRSSDHHSKRRWSPGHEANHLDLGSSSERPGFRGRSPIRYTGSPNRCDGSRDSPERRYPPRSPEQQRDHSRTTADRRNPPQRGSHHQDYPGRRSPQPDDLRSPDGRSLSRRTPEQREPSRRFVERRDQSRRSPERYDHSRGVPHRGTQRRSPSVVDICPISPADDGLRPISPEVRDVRARSPIRYVNRGRNQDHHEVRRRSLSPDDVGARVSPRPPNANVRRSYDREERRSEQLASGRSSRSSHTRARSTERQTRNDPVHRHRPSADTNPPPRRGSRDIGPPSQRITRPGSRSWATGQQQLSQKSRQIPRGKNQAPRAGVRKPKANPSSYKKQADEKNREAERKKWEEDKKKREEQEEAEKKKREEEEKYLKFKEDYETQLADNLKQWEAFDQETFETHPRYSVEWNGFYKRRYGELKLEGKDGVNYDYLPDWKEYWLNKRIPELKEVDVEIIRKKVLEAHGYSSMPGPPGSRDSSPENVPSPVSSLPLSPEEILLLSDDSDEQNNGASKPKRAKKDVPKSGENSPASGSKEVRSSLAQRLQIRVPLIPENSEEAEEEAAAEKAAEKVKERSDVTPVPEAVVQPEVPPAQAPTVESRENPASPKPPQEAAPELSKSPVNEAAITRELSKSPSKKAASVSPKPQAEAAVRESPKLPTEAPHEPPQPPATASSFPEKMLDSLKALIFFREQLPSYVDKLQKIREKAVEVRCYDGDKGFMKVGWTDETWNYLKLSTVKLLGAVEMGCVPDDAKERALDAIKMTDDFLKEAESVPRNSDVPDDPRETSAGAERRIILGIEIDEMARRIGTKSETEGAQMLMRELMLKGTLKDPDKHGEALLKELTDAIEERRTMLFGEVRESSSAAQNRQEPQPVSGETTPGGPEGNGTADEPSAPEELHDFDSYEPEDFARKYLLGFKGWSKDVQHKVVMYLRKIEQNNAARTDAINGNFKRMKAAPRQKPTAAPKPGARPSPASLHMSPTATISLNLPVPAAGASVPVRQTAQQRTDSQNIDLSASLDTLRVAGGPDQDPPLSFDQIFGAASEIAKQRFARNTNVVSEWDEL